MDVQARVIELMKEVDNFTKNIIDKIHKNEFDNLSEIIAKRFYLISELTSFLKQDIDRDILTNYLIALQQRDQVIMQVISKERELIKTTLANFSNIQQYNEVASE